MWARIRRIDYRHWVSLVLILGTLALGVFVYEYPFYRLIEALVDFGKAVAYFFADLFGAEFPYEQSVNAFSRVDVGHHIGIDLQEIYRRLTGLWDEIFVLENFAEYLGFLLMSFIKGMFTFCWIMIVVLAVVTPTVLTWDGVNNNYNEDTKPLRRFKRWIGRPCRAVKNWLCAFLSFFRASGWWTLFLFLWLLYFGLWTVIIEVLAYYCYLLAAFDFATLPVQLLKLVVDVLLGINVLPWYLWAAIFLWLYDRWRLDFAEDRIYALDAHNKRILADVPMFNYIVAPMRTGKDMMMNSMALTFAAMDRATSLDILNDNMKRFPRFPWILFELWLKEKIMDGHIRSWLTARDSTRAAYAFEEFLGRFWGYEVNLYPMTFNDGLKVITLRDALEEYAQAYFTYTFTTSYLVSNAPVRDDFIIRDEGNFVLVDTDYLCRDPELIPQISKYSHIVDWDMFRLGTKVLDKNPNVGAFEFGILVFTEIDKERKNNDALKETKAKDQECNQKNDLFNVWMKMSGHGAMLANRCLLHGLTNAQRPSSWGADGHELCAVMHIEKHKGQDYTLPFFWLELALIKRYLKWWDKLFDESRYRWGDHHLITWLGHGLASVLYRYVTRRGNLYGYYGQKIMTETGTSDEHKNFEDLSYNVIFRTAYAERYASDYFKAFANMQTERCEVGFNDLPTYKGKYPTIEEMQLSHSHLNNDLFRYHDIATVVTAPEPCYDFTDENLDPEDFARKE